jgi:uncharacterized protein DUF4382
MKAAAIPMLVSLVLASACDIALLPETASYEGDATPRTAVVVAADAMPAGDVEAVDLELVDVMLHRESDDTWVWIGGDAQIELSPVEAAAGDSVPLLADYYDRVRVVVDAPRVAAKGKWHNVKLDREEIEIPIELDLDADVSIALHFDVAKSLHGKSAKDWAFDPTVRAEIHP